MNTQPTTPVERAGEDAIFSPAVDIEESQEHLIVWADLPGVEESDLVITMEKQVLRIEAKVRPEKRSSYTLAHREYHTGDFRRVFTISDAIDRGGITATLKDGVLQVVLPKAEPVRPRVIPVNTGG